MLDQGTLHSLVIWPGPYHDNDWDPVFAMEDVWVYEVEASKGHPGEEDWDGFPSFE